MWAGTRRLLLLTVPSPLKWAQGRLATPAQLTLAAAPHGGAAAALHDAMVAAVDALLGEGGGPAWDEAGFARLRDHVAGSLAERTLAVVGQIVAILDARRAVERRLETVAGAPFEPARRDVQRQLVRLLPAGFAATAGAARLPDVERYLRAADRRLERLPDALATDRDRMAAVHELEDLYYQRLETWPRGTPLPSELREVKWLLEELRVAQFAQGIGTRGQVSSKRIRKLIGGREPGVRPLEGWRAKSQGAWPLGGLGLAGCGLDRRGGDLGDGGAEALGLLGGVVVQEARSDGPSVVLEVEGLHEAEGVVVAVPGEDAALRRAVRRPRAASCRRP